MRMKVKKNIDGYFRWGYIWRYPIIQIPIQVAPPPSSVQNRFSNLSLFLSLSNDRSSSIVAYVPLLSRSAMATLLCTRFSDVQQDIHCDFVDRLHETCSCIFDPGRNLRLFLFFFWREIVFWCGFLFVYSQEKCDSCEVWIGDVPFQCRWVLVRFLWRFDPED